MPLTDPYNTLAYHQSRSLTTRRNKSSAPCSALAQQIKAYLASDPGATVKPEHEALWFYGMNHGMALISAKYAPYEPLPPDILKFVEAYYEVLSPKAVRAFYYTLIICIREARHANAKHKANAAALTVPKCGPVAWAYLDKIPGDSSEAMVTFSNNPPSCTLSQLTEMLMGIFFHGDWYGGKESGGYGGTKWGIVTQCAHRFVVGEFTAEMLLDTVWTLVHNGGPIFNKGMLYGHYGAELSRILDVQRSGQIPEMVLNDKQVQPFVSNQLKTWMQWLQEEFPDALGDYVDWFKVEALGSVDQYPDEQAAQIAEHGMPAGLEEVKKLQMEKAAHDLLIAQGKVEEAKKLQAEFEATHYMISPAMGTKQAVYAKKYKRAA